MTTGGPHLLTPAEVAAAFRVDPKTVTRWARAGRISSIRTLGGHRRYNAEEVLKLLNRKEQELPVAARPAAVAATGPAGELVDEEDW